MQQTVSKIGIVMTVGTVGAIVLTSSMPHAAPPKKASPARKASLPKVKAATKLVPNTVRGVVKTSQGKPVSDVTVDVSGTGTQNGGIVSFEPTSNSAGQYQQTDLSPGSYTVLAWKVIRYNGRTYKVPVSPVQGKIEDKYLSRKGIARDFVWRVSGPIPSKFFDADEPDSYYGGSLEVFGRDENGIVEIALPQDTLIKGKLVPDGPLMDGSRGTDFTFEFPFKKGELYQTIQKDIPLGRYTLTLDAALPDGEVKAIRLYDGDGHEDSDFKATKIIEFLQSGSAVRPYQTHFINKVGVSVKL